MNLQSSHPDADEAQRKLVDALGKPACYPHPVAAVRVIETHISRVLLTGEFAYKIKKPVDLGFLDFSTLALRRQYCEDELRLNRRLAPTMYLAVLAIAGDPARPRIDPDADVADAIEYAVQMREFPQHALLDRIAARDALTPQIADAIADSIADFHQRIAIATDLAGSRSTVWTPLADVLGPLSAGTLTANEAAMLARLQAWCDSEYERLEAHFAARRRAGFVRECHGDLHLGNIALLQGEPQIFDCIEFSAALRWIDLTSEIAFLFMDLDAHGRSDLAWRFLNRYLEHTGDYAGLAALRFYQVYRALVRAFVADIRAAQTDGANQPEAAASRARYLACAARALRKPAPQLLLMHGFSASGKSRWSQTALEHIGALRLRSDVERKRLHGLAALARSESIAGGIYTAESTDATYTRLVELARPLLCAGHSVVIDAANLKRWQRERFLTLARELELPCRILSCRADPTTLNARLQSRAQRQHDASEADLKVLALQQQDCDPLDEAERAITVEIDSDYAKPEQMLAQLAAPTHRARRLDHAPS